ncbi:unnamed protein product [Arctogadus glacialis]
MKFARATRSRVRAGRKDFREEQCSQFDGKHFNINGLPPAVRWVPQTKISMAVMMKASPPHVIGAIRACEGVCRREAVDVQFLMKDRCKCSAVSGTMAYYQLEGPRHRRHACGTDTFDICVQGLCRV